AEARLLEREVGEQQMVIHDHDLRGERAPSRFDDKAAIEMIAAAAEAIIDGRRDPAAGRMLLRQILELRKVAAPAGARPRPDGLDRAEGRRVRVAAGAHQLEAMPAQVVV